MIKRLLTPTRRGADVTARQPAGQRCRHGSNAILICTRPSNSSSASHLASDEGTDQATDRRPDGTVRQMVSTGWRRLRQETGARRQPVMQANVMSTGVACSHNANCTTGRWLIAGPPTHAVPLVRDCV